tara:strand:- start:1030 stop:1692 length:663 start_codon:yes stop_codon:yes gene_type:complete
MLKISNLSKRFFISKHELNVLSNINLMIKNNETVALKGPSGSGKTTLLNLISGIDSVSSGKITFENYDITSMNESSLSKFRRDHLGIIFQFFNLIDDLSVMENVMLPLSLTELELGKKVYLAEKVLKSLELHHKADIRTNLLSGGESQRVAIARALVTRPRLIIADEPTGNLDKNNTDITIHLLLQSCKENQTSLIMVSHDETLMKRFDNVYELNSGRII